MRHLFYPATGECDDLGDDCSPTEDEENAEEGKREEAVRRSFDKGLLIFECKRKEREMAPRENSFKPGTEIAKALEIVTKRPSTCPFGAIY